MNKEENKKLVIKVTMSELRKELELPSTEDILKALNSLTEEELKWLLSKDPIQYEIKEESN